MTSKPAATLTRNAPPDAAPDAPRPPERVAHPQFVAALEQFLALVGTDSMSIFADSFEITSDRISFVSVTPIGGVNPVPIGGGDPSLAVWGWPVTVEVDFA